MPSSPPDAARYRERIMREDDLLNSRTTLFLVTNGLLLTAIGLANDKVIPILISILAISVTVGWILVSRQNKKVIATLTQSYRKHHKDHYLEDLVQKALCESHCLRPTSIIATVIPWAFFFIWISILAVYVWRLRSWPTLIL